MKKILKKIWDTISEPFISCSVLIDETRRQNLDGRYDKYWARKNRKQIKK